MTIDTMQNTPSVQSTAQPIARVGFGNKYSNKDTKDQHSDESSVANTTIPTPLESKNFNKKGRNSLHENNFRHNSMSRTLHFNGL